mmetsp:Transcript_5337/g.8380  ORF Transcript_5337/g.8380 Transcript_5337/m.8380 type:complete len:238 (-) Transcript_5337:493-1206(-)
MRLFVLGALSAVTLASFGEIVDPATLHTVKTSQKVVNDAKDIAASLSHDFALDKKLEAAKKKQVKALTSKEHAAELRAANAINKLQLLKHAHDKAEHQLRKVSEKTAVEHVKAKIAKSHALHIEKVAKNVALKKPSKLLSKVLDAAHEKTHAAALKQMKHSAKHEKRVSEAKKRAEQNSHTKTLLKKTIRSSVKPPSPPPQPRCQQSFQARSPRHRKSSPQDPGAQIAEQGQETPCC